LEVAKSTLRETQVSLTSWIDGVDGDFADGANWSTGTVPTAADNVRITVGGTYTVTSSLDENVHSLTVGDGATLDLEAGVFDIAIRQEPRAALTLDPTATIAIANGATLQLTHGVGSGTGSINIADGGQLALYEAGVSGVVNLAGSKSGIDVSRGGGFVGTVQGSGTIALDANGALSPYFTADGILDADQSSNPLVVEMVGPNEDGTVFTVNAIGTLEATQGGQLVLGGSEGISLNASGEIGAFGAGSTVVLDDAVVGGLALTTSAGGLIETGAGGATFGGWQVSTQTIPNVHNAGALLVSGGSTLSVAGTFTNTGTVTVGSAGQAAFLRLELEADVVSVFKSTAASRFVEVAGDGSIVLTDNANNRLGPTSSGAVFDNEGNTITGAGQIGAGSAMNITNRGVIDATGVNALVIDIASGKLSNGAAGLLEGSGSGGLSITGGTVTNTGTVSALDGSSVAFGSGATITNDVAGKLSGGHWYVTDGGHGASLTLSGAAVTTLAGKVELSGAGSVMATGGGTLLEASLATIAASGDLELLAGRGWTSALSLTDNAQLKLIGGTFAAAGLTVGAAGTVSAVGTIAAPTRDNGLVQAWRGALDITGNVTGTGTLKIHGSSSLEIGAAIASTVDVLFGTGTHETLKLDQPAAFASTLTNWSYGDTIDLAATDATAAQIVGNTLEIDLSGGGTLDYALANASAGRVALASDGAGGTNITLYRAKAPATPLIAQHMAAMAAPSAAPASPPAVTPTPTLALIAAPHG
jgi:hypothetical protein